MNISCAYRLVSQDLIENKSSLVPVIAWYRQLANIDPNLHRHLALLGPNELTNWGRVKHIYVSKLTIIASASMC